MTLALSPPIAPQLARSRKELPADDGWAFEPKWDGFRAIVFVDGEQVAIQSRGAKPLERYFPELHFAPGRHVLDGEIVVEDEQGVAHFDVLSQRIHPAASRIERLALETPARFVAFDLLARGDASLLELPFEQRRRALETLAADLGGRPTLSLTPCVRTPGEAEPWLRSGEGVVAKEISAPYRPGERAGMVKVKRVRTIDCVVMGWRPGKEPDTVGSLILGLYDDDGDLRAVGHSSGFTARRKREMVAELAPFETGKRGSGEPSRWNNERELEWIELRPELVVEITFDHASDGRIRHGAKVARWRDDKPPRECGVSQLDE
jgi:ATP-dependent DNA ligase